MGEPSLDTEGRGDILGGKEKGVEGDSHVVGIELPQPRWLTGREQIWGMVGCRVAKLSVRQSMRHL